MNRSKKQILSFFVLSVRHLLHLFAGAGPTCRFDPVCSVYVQRAIEVHGLTRGSLLGLKRLLRCHPWGAFGYDPVVPKGVCK